MSPANLAIYRSLVEQAAIAVLVIDDQLHIRLANTAAGQLFSHDAEKLIGTCLEDVLPARPARVARRFMQRTFESRDRVSFEAPIELQNRGHCYLSVSISWIDQTATDLVAVWLTDITRRVDLERRLRQSDRLVSLGRMASGVSHHFNNLLGGITTVVDSALQDDQPSTWKRALERTAEATARASRIIKHLGNFSEQSPGSQDLSDLTEAVLGYVQLVESDLAQRNITVRIDMNPVPVVAVETHRLHELLQCLTDNATEAMPHGGVIRLTLSADENHVNLEYSDTGRGIDPHIADNIFEPFFTTKGSLGGGDKANTGLGLTIAQKFAEQLGIELRLLSTNDPGAVFLLRFSHRRGMTGAAGVSAEDFNASNPDSRL